LPYPKHGLGDNFALEIISPSFHRISAALSGSASAKVGAAFPGWLQLEVIKTTNSAKARNDVVDIVDFLLWARSELFTGISCNLFATYFVSYSQINGTTKKKKNISFMRKI